MLTELPHASPLFVVAVAVSVGLGLSCAACSHGTKDEVTPPVSAPVAAPSASPTASLPPRMEVVPLSPPGALVLFRVGDTRWVAIADEDAHAISVVPVASDNVERDAFTVDVGGTPARLAFAPDGILYATVRDQSRVVAVALHEEHTFERIADAPTPSDPVGLALSGSTLLVTSGFGHALTAFDAGTLRPLFSSSIAREPRGVIISPDGARAFVSHAVGSVVTTVDLASADHAVQEISLDVKERRLDWGVPAFAWALPGGPGEQRAQNEVMTITFPRTANHGMDLVEMDGDVFVPEALILPGDTTEPTTGYGASGSGLGTVLPYVARIHEGKLARDHISGPDDRGCYEADAAPKCSLPEGVASMDGALYVACAGIDAVVEHRLDRKYDDAPACFAARKAQRRFAAGKGVRALAIDAEKKRAYVWSISDRTVTGLDLAAQKKEPLRVVVPLAPPLVASESLSADVRLGRDLFFSSNDPSISRDGRACASCHPDGREDGLVWPTPKGKRQTPMLAGRVAGTAPFDWNGTNPTLVSHILVTLKNLGGRGLGESERVALAAYLESLPGPHRAPPEDVAAVARGKRIFESGEAACSSCHAAEGKYTDHLTHAFPIPSGATGVSAFTASRTAFDTPSLRFVAGTAPYFHDGRFASLEELIDKCDGVMGQTRQLDASQKQDLAVYLRSL